ncbi:hypothetical protein NADFUDRAFT_82683 [Nadsonia fulvescens var. elongata DSM 6958]|uniref:Uncharacterized protein n=1 Tax=Nadsonia fulvescens var. elongata DSM 6958 TaxID=857566 RepID=A0A1E3PJV5_9ASCO|nr:hypothetical protein NADFUDRAFT_82683 [Nadsonia fulvescens var. elongata DSM 6958]
MSGFTTLRVLLLPVPTSPNTTLHHHTRSDLEHLRVPLDRLSNYFDLLVVIHYLLERATHKRNHSGSYVGFYSSSKSCPSNESHVGFELTNSDFGKAALVSVKNQIKRQRLNITPPSEKSMMIIPLLTPNSLASSPSFTPSGILPFGTPDYLPPLQLVPSPKLPEQQQYCDDDNSGGFLYGYDYYGEFNDQFDDQFDNSKDEMMLTDHDMDLSDNEHINFSPSKLNRERSPDHQLYPPIPDNYSDEFNHDLIDNSVEAEDYIHNIYFNRR